MTEEKPGVEEAQSDEKSVEGKRKQREIKGNLPYIASPAAIQKVLTALIAAERPEKFTNNWLETVLGLSGGANRSVPPILKKMGFLSGDGTPTERYSRFKTESGRSQAVYEGLKDAYSELFRKNEVVHRADEKKVKDLIVEVTGLPHADNIVRLIYNSFEAVRGFMASDFDSGSGPTQVDHEIDELQREPNYESPRSNGQMNSGFGISYHIKERLKNLPLLA